ncbi:MAG: prepilin-type N-terminal cleavage/methylation domain-containing protein [Labilithrix sp.]|nr:prepilin-type N-terminal cleavage/methylation domain-containing protein [Labilithrix sp.]MCW5813563.1 prepilin-type N-terminal cleavage/methylation domain-containing protein [Labilithrix sp.]
MKRRGFSLLEVMVAIAILGLSLTVILSAQGGLAASNRSAANMGTATQLARCKMTEIEEGLLKLGYQEIDQIETGVSCCLDATPETFSCDTRVEKIELPNQNGGNSLGDGGALAGMTSMLGPNNVAGGPGLDLGVDAGGGLGGLQSMTQQLTAGAGADGLISMVMGMLYPSLKPMYEASIRRITVTVRWKEGPVERELPLTQFVTNPQRGGFAGSALMADGGAMDFGPAPGTGGTGGTGTGGTGTGTGTGGTSSGGHR